MHVVATDLKLFLSNLLKILVFFPELSMLQVFFRVFFNFHELVALVPAMRFKEYAANSNILTYRLISSVCTSDCSVMIKMETEDSPKLLASCSIRSNHDRICSQVNIHCPL